MEAKALNVKGPSPRLQSPQGPQPCSPDSLDPKELEPGRGTPPLFTQLMRGADEARVPLWEHL